MRRGIAAAAVLATGCLSVPPYEPEARVTYTEAGTGGTAAGPGFALRFAGGDGFHFPDALMIDGTDVMGHEPAPRCFDEDELGILISPTPRISAHGGAPLVMNHLVPVLRGPGVVQVKLEWATRFECDTARTPGGTATFTVFPDGRIVRYDTLVDPSTSTISPSLCECGPGVEGFTVSTFWTVARERFLKLYAPNEAALPTPTDLVISNYDTACIAGNAYQVAFAWRDSKDTAIRVTDALIGFVRDLTIGASRLDNFSWENSSAIVIEHQTEAIDCMAATTRAREHATPSLLKIDGVDYLPSARDGIYGGDGGNTPPGIVLAATRTELIGPVNSSFAVWLRFPRSVDALRARRDGAKGPWYLPQRVDDRSWIVWFRDSISAGQKITIESI